MSSPWTPDRRTEGEPRPNANVAGWYTDGGVKDWTGQMNYDEETQFRALEYLRRREVRADDEPLFLCVSYTHPHDPFP